MSLTECIRAIHWKLAAAHYVKTLPAVYVTTVLYDMHLRTPLEPIQSQLNPVHTLSLFTDDAPQSVS